MRLSRCRGSLVGNAWQAYAVVVDGKLWAWKGFAWWGEFTPPPSARWNSLGVRYFPPVKDESLSVQLHVAFFAPLEEKERIAAVDYWYAQWTPHPDHPGATPNESSPVRVAPGPVLSAVFECNVQESPPPNPIKYWWCKGNVQEIPWTQDLKQQG